MATWIEAFWNFDLQSERLVAEQMILIQCTLIPKEFQTLLQAIHPITDQKRPNC